MHFGSNSMDGGSLHALTGLENLNSPLPEYRSIMKWRQFGFTETDQIKFLPGSFV